MIREFRHKGLKRFFETGSKAGIQPKHANKLRVQLGLLDVAAKPSDMDVPGWDLRTMEYMGQWELAPDILPLKMRTPCWSIIRITTEEE